MRTRQALPDVLLMTDERMGDALWPALQALPRGAGVIFRHYQLALADRRALFERVRSIARRRGLRLILAGDTRLALAWRADGVHGRSPHRVPAGLSIRTAPTHDRRELTAARRAGIDLLLVSPVFATRSHPGAPALGRSRLGLLVGQRRDDVVALGGMTRRQARSLGSLGIRRWAAIDGLS